MKGAWAFLRIQITLELIPHNIHSKQDLNGKAFTLGSLYTLPYWGERTPWGGIPRLDQLHPLQCFQQAEAGSSKRRFVTGAPWDQV